ncbi:TRAM/LAG1/CLN8 homology domain-containing protein [Zopfochytrium polystomum]|nr:TRAM/LAG1/CLN8 homology domain-containing protein [Zopfochytrium polystomum]
MAVPVFLDPHFRSNRFREYTDYSTTLFSITCGYFLWDSLVCVTQIASNGVGPFVHGLACFAVYIFFAKPIFHYYGAVFLMFELSTPFLNAHWLLSKMGRLDAKTKTLLQGLIYAIFFLVRVLFGPYQSFYFFVNVRDQWDVVPKFAVAVFSVACVALNSLNMLWFYKMTMYIVDGNSKKKTVHRGD